MNFQKKAGRVFQAGLSLVEVLVVMFLSTVIIGALYSEMSAGRTSWYNADAQISLQQELRKAMEQIANDLRQSSSSQISVADGATATSISFNISEGVSAGGTIIWSSPLYYSLSGDQIAKVDSSGTLWTLANNITGLNFTRASKMVTISLSAQKSTPYGRLLSANATTEVLLRN